jgi:hypothetical protein
MAGNADYAFGNIKGKSEVGEVGRAQAKFFHYKMAAVSILRSAPNVSKRKKASFWIRILQEIEISYKKYRWLISSLNITSGNSELTSL